MTLLSQASQKRRQLRSCYVVQAISALILFCERALKGIERGEALNFHQLGLQAPVGQAYKPKIGLHEERVLSFIRRLELRWNSGFGSRAVLLIVSELAI